MDKSKFLPITKTDFGFVQKTSYHQHELLDEEIIEIDSPFATKFTTGSEVFTFLLIGDQNAGKSTFLHSFTFQQDPNFLEITSYLPILSSQFINTRFFFQGKEQEFKFQPMDEPPFIDTDIAKMTLLTTHDYFSFFLDEWNISTDIKLKPDSQYATIQFIELGGDHLDSLMLYETNPNSKELVGLTDILYKSKQTLLEAKKTIYFANASSLFYIQNEELILNVSSFQKVLDRFEYLNKILSIENHDVLVYVSRLPINKFIAINTFKSIEYISSILDEPSKQLFLSIFSSSKFPRNFIDIVPPSLGIGEEPQNMEPGFDDLPIEFLYKVLLTFKQMKQWKLGVVNVIRASHINEETGSLVPQEIFKTLARCFMSEMIHTQHSPELSVVEHLFAFHNEEVESLHVNQNEFSAIFWITQDLFKEYLTEEGEHATVPAPLLLKMFPSVANKIVSNHLAISYYAEDHSNICARLFFEGKSWLLSPSIFPHKQEVAIRFPHYVKLYNFISSYFTHNMPIEFWMNNSTSLTDNAQNVADQISKELEIVLANKWRELNNDSKNKGLLDTFFYVLEEWVLVQKLLEKRHFVLELPEISGSIKGLFVEALPNTAANCIDTVTINCK